ncbi:MAG: DUF2065 domain-containing protein [Candidatus Nitrotoga sp.]|jgi:uncharacterized protein YjeT (DUF2065 family)|nr:DUF2065 domain-containing protein [Candidatus Nitrotoga sp.]MCX7187995.1 DUF2065 domain-containing protein [Pseudomonadota bacterium]MBA0902392.1 DUF2065 domain-containing protein [Candidatus Nitrotoga sp.]MBP0117795.1 DUF2065 domain-containing protein [Candidatus Nitrotoga sp.]MBP0118782.1 DUF2065 domain-containing protein [Candidatus Nitrotoga sp.]
MLIYWFTGLALMLVIEGITPFLFPTLWRETLRKLTLLSDGQIRSLGITAMISGLLVLYWIK